MRITEDEVIYDVEATEQDVEIKMAHWTGVVIGRVILPLSVYEWMVQSTSVAADSATQMAWAGSLIRKLYDVWEPHSDLHRLLAPGHRMIQQLTDEEQALLAKVLHYEI